MQDIFDSVNDNYPQRDKVKIWGKEFSLVSSPVREDEYPLASLTSLIKRFGVDTMYIWYALLQEYVSTLHQINVNEDNASCLQVNLPPKLVNVVYQRLYWCPR